MSWHLESAWKSPSLLIVNCIAGQLANFLNEWPDHLQNTKGQKKSPTRLEQALAKWTHRSGADPEIEEGGGGVYRYRVEIGAARVGRSCPCAR